ncbi:MAG: hypothetical protein IPI82_05345 [Candidatus Microthrix sp.]|nr:hypothetical protein [Candidatus Microthrix sp.]MBK7321875.1 hypothetical protein [Candidatus Microthrix sp.]
MSSSELRQVALAVGQHQAATFSGHSSRHVVAEPVTQHPFIDAVVANHVGVQVCWPRSDHRSGGRDETSALAP